MRGKQLTPCHCVYTSPHLHSAHWWCVRVGRHWQPLPCCLMEAVLPADPAAACSCVVCMAMVQPGPSALHSRSLCGVAFCDCHPAAAATAGVVCVTFTVLAAFFGCGTTERCALCSWGSSADAQGAWQGVTLCQPAVGRAEQRCMRDGQDIVHTLLTDGRSLQPA
jgi:hypothetical protein